MPDPHNPAMTVDELLQLVARHDDWVYALLLAYSIGKTGPMPMIAGFLSYGGTLNPALVLAMVLGGTVIGSQLRFALGRGAAPWLFDTFPRMAPWFALGAAAVDRYHGWLLPSYRFAKGTFSTITIGAGVSSLPWRSFVLPDLCGALAWASTWIGAGMLIGAMGANVDPRWAAYFGLGVLTLGIVVTAVFGSRLKTVLMPHAESAMAKARLRRKGAAAA